MRSGIWLRPLDTSKTILLPEPMASTKGFIRLRGVRAEELLRAFYSQRAVSGKVGMPWQACLWLACGVTRIFFFV